MTDPTPAPAAPSETDQPTPPRRLSRQLTLLFAAATGLAVANLYYAQPLLDLIADRFGVSSGTAGLIVTLTQLGYAAGLLLVVPAGDLLQRRPLVVGLLAGCTVALLGVATAPTFSVLLVAFAAAGFTAVAAQVLLPLAADLAADDQRGTVVGTVMSGLLIGILLARTVSGAVADTLGWRGTYALAAVVTAVLAAGLWRVLPAKTPTVEGTYRSTLWSVLELLRRHRALRVRAAFGVLVFAAFSMLWTTITFLLSAKPYEYSTGTIGLFGLIGAAGAAGANGAGRLADQGRDRAPTGLFSLSLLVSFVFLWWGRTNVWSLIVGVLLLDVAVQGVHVLNFATIYALDPTARSRLNSAYMTLYFLGGSFGSMVGSWAYEHHGWNGVCIAGAITSVALLALWASDRPTQSPKPAIAPTV